MIKLFHCWQRWCDCCKEVRRKRRRWDKGRIDCSLKCVDLHRDKVCCGNRSFQQVFFSWRFRSNYVDLLLTNVITVETQNIAVNARWSNIGTSLKCMLTSIAVFFQSAYFGLVNQCKCFLNTPQCGKHVHRARLHILHRHSLSVFHWILEVHTKVFIEIYQPR